MQAVIEGAERPATTNVRKLYVSLYQIRLLHQDDSER